MILIIDNYDSFTYNLYQYLAQIDEVLIFRNDVITIKEIEGLSPEHIVISPGPGTPAEAGLSMDLIDHFKHSIPILGICLGHQCIASNFGAKIIRSNEPVHGKKSEIIIRKKDNLFKDIDSPFSTTRYHSLQVERKTLPEVLSILAETHDGEIMALRHRCLPIYGLQFHPESILTDNGMKILINFVNCTIDSIKE